MITLIVVDEGEFNKINLYLGVDFGFCKRRQKVVN
jgi:hypothetical protein